MSDLPELLVRYIVGMWRRRWLILTAAWLFCAAGWALLLVWPDAYTSRAQIYLNTDTFLRSIIDTTATSTDFEKRVRIMRLQLLSRENMEAVIGETGLRAEAANEVERARLVADLQNDIKVENDEGQYFDISYSHGDPVIAMNVVDRVVTLFIEQDIGAGIIQSREAVNKIEIQIQNLEADLSKKDQEIAEFRRVHAEELAGSDRTLRQLDLLEDELSRIEDARYSAIRNRDELRQLLAATAPTAPGNELDALKVELAQLQSQYNENYPDIIALKAKIAELESGGAGLPDNPEYKRIETTLRSVESEIADLRQRAVRVRSDIEELTLISSQVPAVQAELQDMMRSYTQIEEQYKNLLGEQISMGITASLSEGGGTIQYNIFEAPVVASNPSYPPRGLLTFLILFVGVGAAGGIAFLMCYFDKTYTQGAEVETALGLPVLGTVSPVLTPKYRATKLVERVGLVSIAGALGVATIALFWFQTIYAPSDAENQIAGIATSISLGDTHEPG